MFEEPETVAKWNDECYWVNLERTTTHNTTNDCYTPGPMAKQIPTGTRPVGGEDKNPTSTRPVVGEQLHNLMANILNSSQHYMLAILALLCYKHYLVIQMSTTRTRIINTYVILC